jgi:hypothetical protein
MRRFTLATLLKAAFLAAPVLLLGACHRGVDKKDIVRAENIPASFDVTLLTAEDLKSALRYRQEQSLPMATVLLKRGEKQKVKKEHVVALARIAYQMKFRAFWDDDGEIAEIKAQLKDAEPVEAPKADAPPKQVHNGAEGRQ